MAYKLAHIVHAMLADQSEYQAQQMQMHDQKCQQRVLRGLRNRASELGFELAVESPSKGCLLGAPRLRQACPESVKGLRG